jgi:tight adherence protein B
MSRIVIYIAVFCSVGVVFLLLLPLISDLLSKMQSKRLHNLEKQLEDMFLWEEIKKLSIYFTLCPVGLGLILFLFFRSWIFTIVGVAIGFFLPPFMIRMLQGWRKYKLRTQLLDTIMYLTSSLKGGLSFLQALEILVEEMPAPISQEFSLVLREHKMGVALEESLSRLSKRMRIEELDLMINSLLVAREMGGDLTRVLSRLSDTIRDNQKLKENIATLTMQGKIQGAIMSVLPIIFVIWVLTFNKGHFDIMLNTELGRSLLFLCAILQVIGMFLIHQFSKLRI